MTDKASMDGPAIAVAATFGVVLMLVSAALFVFVGEGGGGEGSGEGPLVSWDQAVAASDQVSTAGQNSAQSTDIVVDAAVSNVTVTLTACDNTAGTPARGAPTVTWSLSDENGTELDGGEATCAQEGQQLARVAVGGHPDVGQADSEAEVWQGVQNVTRTYTLTIDYSRAPTATDPIPQAQQASFTATIEAEVEAWDADLVERPEEVAPR
jgi:hypothetical protein